MHDVNLSVLFTLAELVYFATASLSLSPSVFPSPNILAERVTTYIRKSSANLFLLPPLPLGTGNGGWAKFARFG